MRKEFVCKECGGNATKEYYQENPDCKQCPEYEECSGAINGYCIISSKDSCPSCNETGHIPLPEMLMMVSEALCDANRAYREGDVFELSDIARDKMCIYIEKGSAQWYKKYFIYTAEHFLALAAVRLLEILNILEIDLYKPEYLEGDFDLQMITDIPRFLGYIIHGFMEYFGWSDMNSFDLSSVIECIKIFCKYHNIPLEEHIEALIAYEKESEQMAHELCNKLDRLDGKIKKPCDNKCINFRFPHLERACVLSEVYSVKQGEGCYIKRRVRNEEDK